MHLLILLEFLLLVEVAVAGEPLWVVGAEVGAGAEVRVEEKVEVQEE